MNDAQLTVELVEANAGADERNRRAARIAAAIRRFGDWRRVGVYEERRGA